MIGLIAIFLILGYILLFALALKYAKKAAIKRGRPPWHFMLPTGIAMYMLVFWDLIPTYAARTYYCTVHAGLEMYKTPEEWIAENTEAAGKLTPIENGHSQWKPDGYQFPLNERFVLRHKWEKKVFGIITELKDSIIDIETNEVMAMETDFKTGSNSFGTGANSISDYKSWLSTRSCFNHLFKGKWQHESQWFSDYRKIYSQI